MGQESAHIQVYWLYKETLRRRHPVRLTTAERPDTVVLGSEANEPPHDKTNKMACAPNENSDQHGHPPSLIRVFAVRLMGS